jgi:hypothetical protein
MVEPKETIIPIPGPYDMMFADHFSNHARRYEAYRPTYPDALCFYLDSLVIVNDLAWDCAAGNGQAAVKLTPYFRSIVAFDASPDSGDRFGGHHTQFPGIRFGGHHAQLPSPTFSVPLLAVPVVRLNDLGFGIRGTPYSIPVADFFHSVTGRARCSAKRP